MYMDVTQRSRAAGLAPSYFAVDISHSSRFCSSLLSDSVAQPSSNFRNPLPQDCAPCDRRAVPRLCHMLLHKQQPILMELQETIGPAAPRWGPATVCSNSLSFQSGLACAEVRDPLKSVLSTARFVRYINSGARIDLSVSERVAHRLSCWMRNGSLRGGLACSRKQSLRIICSVHGTGLPRL